MTSEQAGSGNELWSSENKAFLDACSLKSLFFEEDWVYIIIDLIASKISSQPLRVMTTVTEGENESVQPVPDHPLNALLEQPNEWQDYAQWMYNTAVELFLMGNAVMWHAPRSGQIITLPTENVTLEFDDKGRVSGYTMRQYNPEDGMKSAAEQTFKPKDICHVRRPNPSSLLWGMSPFLPGKKSILFNKYSSDYLNAFYLKQATPGLALSLDRTVNEDVALRQLRSFEVAYQGRKNQRRTLILPKGVTATTLTHSLSDQKLLEHIEQNRETICGLLKVPKHELSLQSAGSLGSEEYRVALRNFWEATLKPGMRFIEGTLTKFFQAELGENTFFQFDISEVEALKDDLKKKAETAVAMLQAGLSVNEVRQQIWQQEASQAEGSDDPFVLFKGAPAPAAAPAPAKPAGGLFQLAGTPEEQKILAPSTKISFTPDIEEFRSRVTKQLAEEESSTITELSEAAVNLLVGMTEEAIKVITSSRKFLIGVETKARSNEDRALARKIQRALAAKFEEEWQGQVARTLSKSVDLGYAQQLTAVFNEKDRLAIEALGAKDAKGRRDILTARGLDSFDQISKTHTERIMQQIEEGTQKGESITNIMRRVATTLGTPKELAGKAETIARTETLTAISIGQAAAMLNAKEVIPGLKKAWLTAGDDRVRDSHRELDGDVVDADAKFANGLEHPRDLRSSDPAQVINCRCTLLMVPPGEKVELPKK
jgi:HK97 family phage portal protein